MTEGKKRREMIFNQLVVTNPMAVRDGKVALMVGQRKVCPQVYCDHWCISRAQLDRYVRLIKQGHRDTLSMAVLRQPREATKRELVISWFLEYAAQVTEKLPDCDKVLLPRMLWKDLHQQFKDDLQAAGSLEKQVCGLEHFKRVFGAAPELRHVEMTTFKRNFQKCKECVKLTAEVNAQLKGHNAAALEKAKDARLAHYLMARSDKLHYYQQRWQVYDRVLH